MISPNTPEELAEAKSHSYGDATQDRRKAISKQP